MKKIYEFISGHIDLICHACVCYILVVTYAIVANPVTIFNLFVAGIVVFGIGIVKEVVDSCSYGTADIKDLAADAIGIVAAFVLCAFNLM